ncbi:PP2C family protein-serine/threonine phosphatase [Nocardioides litoris]|uniref:PP2C family protein-serine/threonine phosphatase n=1 Tax=Nocardioides litoris TaxID=1926648 RepID=UPI001FE34E2C|nr:PP2C family protein-serine/threonine phosphatase [Nocardioides litoris]
MTSAPQPLPRAPRTPPLQRALTRVRRPLESLETRVAIGLAVFSVTVAVLVSYYPDRTPFTTLVLPVVLGSILLGPRTLPWFVVLSVALLSYCLTQQDQITPRTVGAAAVQYAVALVVLASSFRRTRLGVAGLRGETMFVDLRDRILRQGTLPDLPEPWLVESSLRSAGGTAFAGDFVVAARSPDRTTLQVGLVDVSGKGEEAGTRALLLSGAFGGLLGAVPPAEFLPACNTYLMRQDWEEGFATAAHLWLDLVGGRFEVRTAGHPPVVLRTAGDGQWRRLDSGGPVIGLVDEVDYHHAEGVLGAGDALLLYTDGMVEEPRHDIEVGIDRLVGEAEAALLRGPEGTAEQLTTLVGSRNDDRAVVLVHRR